MSVINTTLWENNENALTHFRKVVTILAQKVITFSSSVGY